ncbi:MAG: hypothetical protein LBI18_11610 [Planctomycetaceae bacterium]|nr:hypothetical protein [Planctomycetaceae bacterium]
MAKHDVRMAIGIAERIGIRLPATPQTPLPTKTPLHAPDRESFSQAGSLISRQLSLSVLKSE